MNPFRVLLDDLTTARLLEQADAQQCEPWQIIASIVHDVLEDDARMHDETAPLTLTLQ